MEFMGLYMLAMRECAPKMFNRLRRTGALEAFAKKKAIEASEGYSSGANLRWCRYESRGAALSNPFCVLNQRVLLHPKSTTVRVASQAG